MTCYLIPVVRLGKCSSMEEFSRDKVILYWTAVDIQDIIPRVEFRQQCLQSKAGGVFLGQHGYQPQRPQRSSRQPPSSTSTRRYADFHRCGKTILPSASFYCPSFARPLCEEESCGGPQLAKYHHIVVRNAQRRKFWQWQQYDQPDNELLSML